jgi:hypothetical protein
MVLRNIIAVYSKNHMKHTKALCGKKAEPSNVKAGVVYKYHSALKD